ncbi:hypothetical protein PIB30_043723 [Stylosanthes scabra]|uniref:Uncharacterized protein n=1 Tax=Stylosanthes scabra TaxID=79078 RepID=A0ABU6VE13_9FABA|nr:hypothetical protein [Stylosanthes scabra]
MTYSTLDMLAEECLEIFGRQPEKNDHTGGKLHLSWIEQCRNSERLDIDESIKREGGGWRLLGGHTKAMQPMG